MADVTAFFAAGGALARVLPSFEPRPEQARMAAEVLQALRGGRHLLVEAGTGVGKSLAYLLPAILWAVRDGPGDPDERRVIVSTHTRALQEQLARKDLPLLERALGDAGLSFRHALLMGSENYLCVQRLHLEMQQRRLVAGPEAGVIEALARYAGAADSGLRTTIPFPVPEPIWARVRRDRDICLGPRGPFWESCLHRRDLSRARQADLLVVNHALFFLDLASGGRILPPHGVAILDEAHRLEETAIAQFGVSVSDRTMARLTDEVAPFPRRSARGRTRRGRAGRRAGRAAGPAETPADPLLEESARRLRDAAAGFFEEVRRQARSILDRHPRRSGAGPGGEGTAGFIVRIRTPGLAPNDLAGPLDDLESDLREAARGRSGTPEGQTLSALAERARDLRERITLFLEQRLSDAVYWVEAPRGRSGGAALHAAPVEVAPILRERLFESGRRVVLTSATLTAAGSFAHMRRRLGITAAAEVALGSPYDYERQALLYLPADLPDPGTDADGFASAVIRECREVLRASEGGAFVLFTSYALLRRAYEALSSDPGLRDLRFFRHDPGHASAILEDFRMTRRGVLLGTLTFWQGVDVPGDALRSVIITRLPFDVPDDPLAEARSDLIRSRGGDPFEDESLPSAILTFRQGFGRLIRTREDRGCVAVLDPRLRTRSYGRAFLASLPPCRRTSSLGELKRFFAVSRG